MTGTRKPTQWRAAGAVDISLRPLACPHSISQCQSNHPNIKSYRILVQRDSNIIGYVKVHVLDKAAMGAPGSAGMWAECQAYDEHHFGMKLDKIENFLENENFLEEAEVTIQQAQVVVYIEEVLLEREWRGRGLGIAAIQTAIRDLALALQSVVLLEPGAINSTEHHGQAADAGEKLEKHWKELGFDSWSDSDTAWLCLSLEDIIWSD